MNIQELVKKAHGTAVDKGFWDSSRNTGELLMLVVSEIGEALEADRKNRHCDLNQTELTLGEDIAKTNMESFQTFYEENVKGSFEEEIADAFIRLADLVGGFNIDIEKHIALKMMYNTTREKLHGKKY